MNLVEDRETIIELEPQELEFLSILHKAAYRFDEHIKDRTPTEICISDRLGGHTNFQIRLKPMPKTAKIEMRTWVK
jgi:hypothetical protein